MTFNGHVMSEASGTIVSAFATTASALIVAYVFGAILGINRLVWIGTHQGTFCWAYCSATDADS